MPRWILPLTFGFGLIAQVPPPVPPKSKPPVQEEMPPEEDAAAKPKEYSFNPLQAQTELNAGEFYFKKGKYSAAAGRFREATMWNPGAAEAYLRLGETAEKQHDLKTENAAYSKYLELAPDSKRAPEIRKKLAKHSS